MNRIETVFERLRQKGEKALVGFVTAGDPSEARSLEIIRAMCEAGLDILELGIPFSDPTADGPVIPRSSGRALKAGMTLRKALGMAEKIRRAYPVPIVIFSYYNPILAYGAARFYQDASAAGADGVLVVDLPPEESDELSSESGGVDLALIRLVAPTTPPSRMATIAKGSSGFLYVVSMTGVTGSGGLNVEEISEVTRALASQSNGTPICIGFGISSPEQVREIGALADGVVVGSAFERLIETHLDDPGLPSKIGAAVRALKEATR
jgi:tryptophan synthase alpha chain